MISSLEDLLLLQSLLTLTILVACAYFLARRGLFRWTSAGFWSWSAFAVYFFLNPLASLYWNITHYRFYLSISGGLDHGAWIGLVALIGIVVFFVSYLSYSSHPVTWGLNSKYFTPGMKLIGAAFALIGIISFLSYRMFIGSHSQQFSIVAGRFIGQTTGYAYGAHMFIFFVIVSLLLAGERIDKVMASGLTLGYVVFSFLSIWSRFTTISLLIAFSLALTTLSKRKWPGVISLVAIFVLAAVLIIRGHNPLANGRGALDIVTSIPNRVGAILSSGDTAMLASWYAESYIKDEISGYDYGIPLLNYVIFGPIPGRIFPEKYFLIDWLQSIQKPVTDPTLVAAMYGAKTSLFGSFYAHGGLIGVILLSVFAGFLCRKLDAMLSTESPNLVKTAGICMLSILWMAWGSSDTWCLMTMGTLVLPAIVVWVFAPKSRGQPHIIEPSPTTASRSCDNE